METREYTEASILGSMLLDEEATEYIMSEAKESLFKCYDDVFRVFKDKYSQDLHVDITTLKIEGIDAQRIENIANSVHTSVFYKTHLQQLKHIDFTERSMKYADDIKQATTLEQRIEIMSNIPMLDLEAEKHKTTREMTQEVLNEISARAKNHDDIKGIRTGFPTFDKMTGGLFKGGVTVVDGDTNIGKSLFCEKLGLNVSKTGKIVDYFAYEMSNTQCVERMLAMQAGINISAINNPKAWWTGTETQQAQDFYESQEIQNINFFADELHDFTFNELKSKVNKMIIQQGRKPEVIIVDYVELMTGEGETDVEVTKNNFEALMRLAKHLKTTNIVMVISRNKNGQMSGSNKLAYHAHMHIKLDPSTEVEGLINCKVKKNRDGGKGDIDFVFDSAHLKFMEGANDV